MAEKNAEPVAIKAVVEKIEDVPEQVRGLYTKEGDRYVLNTQDVKITELQAELEKLKQEKTSLDKTIEAEVAKRLKAIEEKQERERKRKEGDLQGLLDTELEKNRQLTDELARLKRDLKQSAVREAIRQVIDETDASYAKAVKYIAPLVQVGEDADEAAIRKAAKEAVEQFVKDNPRPKEAGGVPPNPAARGKAQGGEPKNLGAASGANNEKVESLLKRAFDYARW